MKQQLKGISILVVEDEPLIAMDIAQAFQDSGAAITSTNTLHHALVLVNNDGLSAAIIDHALGSENSNALCKRLRELHIPFIVYSGYKNIDGPCSGAPHINKPATHAILVHAMQKLLRRDGQCAVDALPN